MTHLNLLLFHHRSVAFQIHILTLNPLIGLVSPLSTVNKLKHDDEYRFADVSTHEGHLCQNGELTCTCNVTPVLYFEG